MFFQNPERRVRIPNIVRPQNKGDKGAGPAAAAQSSVINKALALVIGEPGDTPEIWVLFPREHAKTIEKIE